MTIIEHLKTQLPIAPFVAPFTHGLKATGPYFFIGHCPFHQAPDDPPHKRKFWVNTRFNICGCFNPRCSAYANTQEDPTRKPLDIINFWSLLRDITIEQAIAELARKANIGE